MVMYTYGQGHDERRKIHVNIHDSRKETTKPENMEALYAFVRSWGVEE